MNALPSITSHNAGADEKEAAPACVAWEVEINYLSCVVFAPTKAKARWLAVKAYWDAYSRTKGWPHTSIARRPQWDRFPYFTRKAYSPEYVRDLCPSA